MSHQSGGSGTNAQYGRAKRKRSGPQRGFASALSRNLFFNKGPQGAPMTVQSFDKMFSRSLARRHISTPEQKYKEVEVSTTVSTTQALSLINGMVQGDTNATRDGLKIVITKLEFECQLIMSETATGGFDRGKISLFIDKNANGAAPLFSTITGSAVIAPYTNSTGFTPLLKNGQFDDQFYIIKDWDYVLDANSFNGPATVWQRDTVHLKYNKPLRRVIEYNLGNAGTVADIVTNAMYVGRIGGQAAGATATSMAFLVRIWYTDA